MQISEIYRRGIVLGKTSEAIRELYANNVTDQTDVTRLPISHSLFGSLWAVHFFQGLSRACDTFFGDYEEDFLLEERFEAAQNFLRDQMKGETDVELQAFYQALFSLLQDAKSLHHPILVVL